MLRLASLFLFFVHAFNFAPLLRAQQSVFTLDPSATKIEFTLGATLHTVHGTFRLKSGEIRFDPATGKASGAIVVDAASGNTNNTGRDSKMHKEILESAKFSEIVFTPKGMKGPIVEKGASQVEVSGVMRLHGQDHEMTLTFTVEPVSPGQLQAATKFAVPYIQWGLRNPSNFLLHVSDTVNVEIHAAGRLVPAAAP